MRHTMDRHRMRFLVVLGIALAVLATPGLPMQAQTTAPVLLPSEQHIAPVSDQPVSVAYHRVEHPHWPTSLEVPNGFTVDEVASSLSYPRFMAIDSDGSLVYGSYGTNTVVRLRDNDGNGSYDIQQVVATGLSVVHSVAFHGGVLYAAAMDRVVRLSDFGPDGAAQQVENVIYALPTRPGPNGYNHRTRTLLFGPDAMLYLSVGSSCDACEEAVPQRATILRTSVASLSQPRAASEMEIFAYGLRNSVGIAFHPATNQLWGVDMGRDDLGPELPPEELNLIEQHQDYGWPYCYGDRQPNPEFNDLQRCAATQPPRYTFQSHSAPLGIAFYDKDAFPANYRGDALIAFHGSNPTETNGVRLGARVLHVSFERGQPVAHTDLLRGFEVNNRTWARPAGILVAPDGSVLVSDDYGGRIFRIRYVGNS